MNDPTTQTVALDEQVWREWVDKGKLREQYRTGRRRKVGSILAVVAVTGVRHLLPKHNLKYADDETTQSPAWQRFQAVLRTTHSDAENDGQCARQ